MALDALAAGAVAVVAKPRLGLKQFLEDSRRELLQTLKTAARTRPRARHGRRRAPPHRRRSGAAAARAPVAGLHALSVNKPVVLGTSTGGTQAIEAVLMALPADAPGIAIVQHMPEKFTAMYAQRLEQPVRDARARSARRRPPGTRRGADRARRPPHAAAQGRRPVLRRRCSTARR